MQHHTLLCSYSLVLGIIVILLSANSLSLSKGSCGDKEDGSPVPCDYSDEFYKNADYDSVNIEWEKFDQSKVPKDRLFEIPPERVDPSKVSDTSQLTKDQLTYTPFGGEPNINKVENWQALDPKVRDEVLSDVTGKNVKTVLKDPTSGKVNSRGFEIDNAESIMVGHEAYSGVTGFQYKDGKSSASKAQARSTPDSTATNNLNRPGFAGEVNV